MVQRSRGTFDATNGAECQKEKESGHDVVDAFDLFWNLLVTLPLLFHCGHLLPGHEGLSRDTTYLSFILLVCHVTRYCQPHCLLYHEQKVSCKVSTTFCLDAFQ